MALSKMQSTISKNMHFFPFLQADSSLTKVDVLTYWEYRYLSPYKSFENRMFSTNFNNNFFESTKVFNNFTRLFAFDMTREELAFVIKSQLTCNIYDNFLLKFYLKNYIEQLGITAHKQQYKILYFKEEINIQMTDIDIINALVKLTDHTRNENASEMEQLCINSMIYLMEYWENNPIAICDVSAILKYPFTNEGLAVKNAFQNCLVNVFHEGPKSLNTVLFFLKSVACFDPNLVSNKEIIKNGYFTSIPVLKEILGSKINVRRFSEIPLLFYVAELFEKFKFVDSSLNTLVEESNILYSHAVSLFKFIPQTEKYSSAPAIASLSRVVTTETPVEFTIDYNYFTSMDYESLYDIYSSFATFKDNFSADKAELTDYPDKEVALSTNAANFAFFVETQIPYSHI